MEFFNDNDSAKASGNFAYKNDQEKNELHEHMYAAKMDLELKFQIVAFSLIFVIGAGSLLYFFICS